MSNGDRHSCDTEGADARVTRIATGQHGVISYDQALETGLTRAAIQRRATAGRWIRLLPRVYRVGGAPATGRQGMMAATLWAGAGALLSHLAAGVLHGLDGVTADGLEVTASKRLRSGAVLAHFAPPFTVIDRDVVDGIPVTSPTRTLIDLAGVLDADSLEFALEDALRRGLTSRARVGHRLREMEGHGRSGCASLRALLDVARGQTHSGSAPEVRLRRALSRAGLPPPARQHEIRHRGRLIARVDLAYPDLRIAVEFDSERWHGGRRRREADMERRNRLTALGWHVVHVGWSELSAGLPTVTATLRALIEKGAARQEPPPPRRCA
jgi:very-short-patch-repair endonuclease